MELGLMQGTFVVARYKRESTPTISHENIPTLLSITWTEDECTVVCPENELPDGYEEKKEGWAVLRIEGVLDFSLIGVIASVLAPLGQAGVSVFTLSTFSTDYVLVKNDSLDSAVSSLRSAGFIVGLP
ncbi:MAG TPA: ACT domain-containing protein [Spirochaetota bacterium]